MLEKVKQSLRIDGNLFDDELDGLIEACKKDLLLSGVDIVEESNPIISRAIIFYCKAYFGYPDKHYERLVKSYEMLRNHIALCDEFKAVKPD